MNMQYDVCIIGGCGHVGLPLGIALADKGKKVCLLDINGELVKTVNAGIMPFIDEGAPELLTENIEKNKITATENPRYITESQYIIIVTGTPLDEYFNPQYTLMEKLIEQYFDYFRNDQVIIIRSTAYPGTGYKINRYFNKRGKNVHLVICPERIAEGKSVEELKVIPQIVASYTNEGLSAAQDLLSVLNEEFITLKPLEAELSKLMCNVWRYIKFAVANQFFMIANNCGLDYNRIYHAITHNYERAKDLPIPGFTAGPCLFKDAVQLGIFNNSDNYLGYNALLINEGLPHYIVKKIKEKYDIANMNIGILGMAFKAESDDIRMSLSCKLKKILEYQAKQVLCTDPYVNDERLQPLETVIEQSDIIIIAVPHHQYKNLSINGKITVDMGNVLGKGSMI